jgi:hypothetical protein
MCCPPDMVGEMWPHVRALAGLALDRTDLGSLADLDADVLSGRALLWVISGEKIECAGVTEIHRTQHSKVCFIRAFGGKHHKKWKHLLSGIEEFARAEDCDVVRWIGRKGWARILPEYRVAGVVMERRINGQLSGN